MLSFETEKRISNLLFFIGKSYREINAYKKEININRNFEPFLTFSRIDQSVKGNIDVYDIINVFKEHGDFCSIEEGRSIIMWYDYNFDGLLTYGEFMGMILPDELRNIDHLPHHCFHNIRGFQLSWDVEKQLYELLSKLLRFNRQFKDMIMNSINRVDFSNKNIFELLGGKDYVYKEGIRNFFIRRQKRFTESDIDDIMNMLCIEKNGKITKKDIEIIFSPLNELNDNNYSTIPQTDKSKRYQKFISDEVKNNIKNSPFNNFITINSSYCQNERDLNNYTITLSDNLLVNIFEQMYRCEIELEELKIILAMRGDFNIEDAFVLFEISPGYKNELTIDDIINGFNSLGLYPKNSEVKLLIKKYSLMNTGCLNYADFFDMVTPFNKKIREIVEKRNPSDYTFKYNKSDFFLGETKKLFEDLLEKIILSENKIEVLRKRVSKSFAINVMEFVQKIDNEKKGFLSIDNIRSFIKMKIDKNASNKNSDLVFIRLDRGRELKVSYENVIREFEELR